MLRNKHGLARWIEWSLVILTIQVLYLVQFILTNYGMPTVGRVLLDTDYNHHQLWWNLGFEISRWAELIILPIALGLTMLLIEAFGEMTKSIRMGLLLGISIGIYFGVKMGLFPFLYVIGFITIISGIFIKGDIGYDFEEGIGGGFALVIGVFTAVGCFAGLLPGIIFAASSFIVAAVLYVTATSVKSAIINKFTPSRVNRKN